MIPLRRVERRAREIVAPRDGRQIGTVELPDGADHGACRHRVRRAVGVADSDLPRLGRLIPSRAGDLGLEPDVRADAVLVQDAFEIGLQLRLFGEELRPVVAGFKAVAVEVVSDIDAGTGIAVVPPGAADTGGTFDGERNSRLFQADSREQSRFAAADDEHGEVGRRFGVTPGRAAADISPVELHLLQHHRDVLVGHRLADEPLHHLLEQLRTDGLGLGAPAVAVVRDHLQRQGAHGRLVVLGHVTLDLVEEQPGGAQGAADQLRITGHLHQ